MNNAITVKAIRWAGIALVLVLLGHLESLPAATFFYTHGRTPGGLESFQVNSETGEITAHDPLPGEPLKEPQKLAISGDGSRIIVTSGISKTAWIFQTGATSGLLGSIPLADETGEVQALGSQALIASGGGDFFWIDLQTAKIAKQWNARTGLQPPGNKGEDILFLPDKNLALLSFQKDGKSGKNKGSRIVLLDLPTVTPKADLPLPREYPALNIPANKREQGPNPELIFIAPKSNTLAVSLDLYGAVAFADLDAALRGQWKNLTYIPTAPDGSWGTAFPDRGTFFELGGKEYLLIANASENGGLALFDVAARKILQTFEAPAGAERPIFLPKLKKAVTVISGKIKQRTPEGLEKDTAPGNELLVLDLAPLESGGEAAIERIAFEQPVVRVEAIDPETSALLLLVTGNDEFVIYDLASKTEIARESAHGVVNRLAVWRGK